MRFMKIKSRRTNVRNHASSPKQLKLQRCQFNHPPNARLWSDTGSGVLYHNPVGVISKADKIC